MHDSSHTQPATRTERINQGQISTGQTADQTADQSTGQATRRMNGQMTGINRTAALVIVASVALSAATQLWAEAADPILPELGNTAESDIGLLKEIGDDHVYTATEVVDAVNDTESGTTPDTSQQQTQDSTPATSSLPDTQAATSTTDQFTVWDKIRASEPLPITVNEAVKIREQQYIDEALWINKILRRSKPYLHYIVKSLDARGLPTDLAMIPAIESGFQPRAASLFAATGLWQIVPITAREIGLKRTSWLDERTDLRASTQAALDYISYLQAEFNGDWEHTLAAYNAGPGRVRGAIRKNKKLGKPTDFWSLELPPQTVEYVPKITAMVNLIRRDNTPLDLPDIPYEDAFVNVDVGTRISLDRAAALAEIKESELSLLNAGLIHGVTPPEGPHKLLLPKHAVASFMQNLDSAAPDTLYSLPAIHTVVAGDSLSTIARKYGVSTRRLKAMNGLTSAKILIGQKLAVLDAKHVLEKNRKSNNAPVGSLQYTIQKGDTLSEIAESFGVKMSDISTKSGANAINQVLIPGQKLTIHNSPGQNKS